MVSVDVRAMLQALRVICSFITVQLFSIKWSHKTEQAMITLRLINTQEVSCLTGKDLNAWCELTIDGYTEGAPDL